MNIHDKAHELARALRESQEFDSLQKKRLIVETNPESKKLLDDFHKKQVELQTIQLSGKPVTPQQQKEFESIAGLAGLNPTVRDYLAAEMQMIRIMEDIQKILSEALTMG